MSKILEEAMQDAKQLRETAIESARNQLVEALSPKIKEMVDSQLGVDAAAGGMPEASMYEDNENQDKELLVKLLGQGLMSQDEIMSHLPGGDAEGGDIDIHLSPLGVGEDEVEIDQAEDGEEEDMDETIDVTQEDVKAAFSEALNDALKEATVKAGFGKAADVNKGEKGLSDEKGGEQQWNDADAPAAKDWTVKESAYKAQLKSVTNENAKLKTENSEYRKACDYLKKSLQEVTLFNSKLLYTNKVFQSVDLNNKQRVAVIEQFDNAESMREVELIYKSLSESLKIAGVVNESKVATGAGSTMKGPKSSRFTTPSSTILKEGASNSEQVSSEVMRWRDLAGLVD